jgi:hypothetical protein
MNKIPVGQTIAFAYNFVFTRFGTVVGLTALPALFAAVVDYLVRSYTSTEDTQAAAGVNLLISLAGMATTIFVWAVAAVGITRAALGIPLGSGAYYFPVGMVELRLLGAMLRFWLSVAALLILASLVTSLAFMLAGVPLDGTSDPEPSAALLVAGIVAWAAFGYAIYTVFRMGFLLSGTVVCEPQGGLQRSHDLARGNFWRIVAILIAIVLPIMFLLSVAGAVILRASLGPDYSELIEDQGANELIRRGEELIAQNLLLWELFNMAIFILAAGLIFSAGAHAYRTLTAKPSSEMDSLRPPAAGN